jgi:hypothetical protein
MLFLKTVSIFHNERLLSFPKNIIVDENNSIEKLHLTHNIKVTDLPTSLFTPLKNLKELKIGSNNFSVIPHDLLNNSCDKLTKLVIKEDYIYGCPSGCNRTLPPDLLKSCKSLEEFEYSFHKVDEKNLLNIPANFFEFQKSTLKNIVIDKTNLEKDQLFGLFFNGSQIKPSFSNLKNLWISLKPIYCKATNCTHENSDICDCILVTKLGDLATNIAKNNSKSDSVTVTCYNNERDKVQVNTENLLNIYIPYCQRIDLQTITFYIAGIAIFFFSMVIVLCAKEHILVWLYNHPCFSKLFEIKITETKCICEMHQSHADCRLECYCRDAFISYSHEDENFALLLRENLEDNGGFGPESVSYKQMAGRSFSCLDHQRDWKAGNPISLNIG